MEPQLVKSAERTVRILEVLADALWGPIFHRLLVNRMPIDRGFVDKLLDLVLGNVARRG